MGRRFHRRYSERPSYREDVQDRVRVVMPFQARSTRTIESSFMSYFDLSLDWPTLGPRIPGAQMTRCNALHSSIQLLLPSYAIQVEGFIQHIWHVGGLSSTCLLYTSDAADERSS